MEGGGRGAPDGGWGLGEEVLALRMASILGCWALEVGGKAEQPHLGAVFLSQCLLTSLSFPFCVLLPIPAANHERQMDQHWL